MSQVIQYSILLLSFTPFIDVYDTQVKTLLGRNKAKTKVKNICWCSFSGKGGY